MVFKHVPPQFPQSIPCRIAFVGEAPSDEETIRGKVLVGPSGRVYDHLLRVAGLAREDYLTTNVFDEQAPKNDTTPWLKKDEFAPLREASLARLSKEIQRVKPTVIVPMGGTALWAFTGITNITDCRGAVGRATSVAPGVKLLPTLHPAHVLHDWRMFHVVVADFTKAKAESEYPEIRLPKREIWIRPTLDDLDYYRRTHIDGADLLSIDIETGGGQITCIGFAPDSRTAIVVPFVDWTKPDHSYWATLEQEIAAWAWCRGILQNETPKLFQNGPYDTFWLWDKARIKVRNYLHDTRLVHHALYPELPKSLGFMGASYANATAWKLMRAHKPEKRDE